MGNMVADAMRLAFPGAEAALTNSGGLRIDLLFTPPGTGEQPGEITWGEAFAVLPFGNRTVILTLTGIQLQAALSNGVSPFCSPAIATGRFPQVSGLRFTFACNGALPAITGMWKTASGSPTPIGPADTVRLVTNDFMFSGGDGYGILSQGTNVQQGNSLLQIAIEYIATHSPVGPVVEGRIVGP
jgi:2',3'-cyclic-nucleotide 2'-phosphodiesterase (5'-nucleotidase family)